MASTVGLNSDPEMQTLLAQEELLQNMKKMLNICWDKCMHEGVDSKLSSRQESCLSYCADRYVDAAMVLTNRFNQRLSGGHH